MTNEELELEHIKVEHLIDTVTKPLYKRINELENIINELKKYCESQLVDMKFECELYYKDILDKIKELENDL